MPPVLYKFGRTSQYVTERRMERRERLWNTSHICWWSEKPNPICPFHGFVSSSSVRFISLKYN
jgi:hypothetical protein